MLIIFSTSNATHTTAIAMKLTFIIIIKNATFQTKILAKLDTTINTLASLVLYGLTSVAGYLDDSKHVYFMTVINFIVTQYTWPQCVTLGTDDITPSSIVATFIHYICKENRIDVNHETMFKDNIMFFFNFCNLICFQ